MRKDMPKAAALEDHEMPMMPISHDAKVTYLPRNKMLGLKEAAEHFPDAPLATGPDGTVLLDPDTIGTDNERPITGRAGGLLQGPRHIGMRRYSQVKSEEPLDPEPEAEESA